MDSLKKAIARAKEVNVDHQLDLQLALANRLKDQLERIEKLRHSVLNLDTKTIAEIKTYSNPPDGVHQSMMATFILLGNHPKEVKVGLISMEMGCKNENGQIACIESVPISLYCLTTKYDMKCCLAVTLKQSSFVIQGVYTVELQWLEHLYNHENMFETGVVRDNQC